MNYIEYDKGNWDDNEFFNPDNRVEPKTQVFDQKNDKDVIDIFVDVSKNTKDLIVDESKTIAPAIAQTFQSSAERLNSEKRIIDAIPNSYLYYGLIILGLGIVFRKSL